NLSASLGVPIRGIVGAEFFAHRVVGIDYQTHTLTLHDPEVALKLPAGEVLEADFADGTPYVAATLEPPGGGADSLRMLVDTGATGCIALNTPTVDRLGLTEPASSVLPITSAILSGPARSMMRRLPA